MIDEMLSEINSDIDKLNGIIEEKKNIINKKTTENLKIENSISECSYKKLLLQEVSLTARKVSYDMFASVATNGLQSILGENLFVEIKEGESAGNPTADFLVKTIYNGYETLVDPTEADGGGVADIIALSSIFCMNILNSDNNSAPMFLDEPTKYVSSGLAADVGRFIKEISEEYKKQVIMVTHSQEIKDVADTVFEVELDENGSSVVKTTVKP